jgi:hypothetical protein
MSYQPVGPIERTFEEIDHPADIPRDGWRDIADAMDAPLDSLRTLGNLRCGLCSFGSFVASMKR